MLNDAETKSVVQKSFPLIIVIYSVANSEAYICFSHNIQTAGIHNVIKKDIPALIICLSSI